MNTNGVVKIGCLEKCVLRDQNESHKAELVSVGNITMELLQKYVKNEGRVGIDKLDRWSSDSVAVSFLSATTSANSIKTLMEENGALTYVSLQASPNKQNAFLQGGTNRPRVVCTPFDENILVLCPTGKRETASFVSCWIKLLLRLSRSRICESCTSSKDSDIHRSTRD
ncbi:uncharacterized protein ANIA_09022 [Aspergillus nidulans FGSC A4]|uniref:Uncharacterized protein n=1 Tax=Emericella nidulans (strain FGSC A4 / ATCC 38163 / CBS 112.46 / NRRL 194 / M139) TaxID=227321 RepID=C8VKX8_EMENI|nr:hypothetical protein [Aspergillus nidulans FGSC A4]CBF84443.1 TPA: hypothetical protein ANIA_09022 [Aspergillus nidulans FGSC A4]